MALRAKPLDLKAKIKLYQRSNQPARSLQVQLRQDLPKSLVEIIPSLLKQQIGVLDVQFFNRTLNIPSVNGVRGRQTGNANDKASGLERSQNQRDRTRGVKTFVVTRCSYVVF